MKASKLGDAAILKELIKILSENKIKVVKLNTFNPELTLQKGYYTKIKPSKIDKSNIQKGIKILKKLNSYNHVQALVINENGHFTLEKRKGTKQLLKKIKITKSSNILIKIPKLKQDLRADLPTIGLDTIRDCVKFNVKGIVIKSNQHIFLNQKESIKYANKNNLFLTVI